MTSRNPITGDKLQTKPATKEFRDNYDRIFGKKEEKECCGKCSPCKGHDTESKKDEENDQQVQESK